MSFYYDRKFPKVDEIARANDEGVYAALRESGSLYFHERTE